MYVHILREHRDGEENGRIISVHANPQKIMDEMLVNWVKEDQFPPKWWGPPNAEALADSPELANAHYTLTAYGVN
jgi:hypothetical protein